jgi:hypothetical protein
MPGLKHHIYGICGFAGAGKDTVADILVSHAGFRRMAFADSLRGEVQTAFNVDGTLFMRRDLKEKPLPELALNKGPRDFTAMVLIALHLGEIEHQVPASVSDFLAEPRSPRQILQWWGTQYRRAMDPGYWTKQLARKLEYHWDQGERHFVIPDCRFANEVQVLRARGGWLWQIQRPGGDEIGAHVSVTDGTEFNPDTVLLNDQSIKHLQQLVLGRFWAQDAGLEHVAVQIA